MGDKRAVLAALGVLTAVVTLVGCANPVTSLLPKMPVAPTSTPDAAEADCLTAVNMISACTRLGDLTTLDPCSLVSLNELPPDLDASPKARESLDYCVFDVTAGPDKDAELQIGQPDSVSDEGVGRYTAGSQDLSTPGLELQQGALLDGECDDALRFGGDLVDLEINVFVTEGAGSQSLCDAANGVGNALATVIGGKTQMQHFTVPKNSIARLKACLLLDGTQIGTYPVGGTSDSPSGHSCQWTPDPTDDNVEIGVQLEVGPKLASGMADSTSKIQGLDTYLFKDSESGYSRCEVDTDRAPWGSAGNGLVETVALWAVEDAGKVDTACSLVNQMANIVWPKLPPIS